MNRDRPEIFIRWVMFGYVVIFLIVLILVL